MGDKIDKTVLIKNFSRHAASYDGYTDVQNTAAKILADMLPGDDVASILEIGCGTGNYTLLLRKKFKGSAIKAIDISDAMIKIAREKMADAKTDFVVEDAELMGFDNSYDLITSNAAFQWLVDPGKLIERSAASLTLSGKLAFSSFGPSTFGELKRALTAVIGRNVAMAPDLFPGREYLESALRKNFKSISITEKLIKKTYPSIAELFKKIKYSGTQGSGSDIRRVWSPDLLSKIEKKYLEHFGAVEATYQIFFCEAIKCG